MDPGKEGPLAKENTHKAPSTVTSTQGVSDPSREALASGAGFRPGSGRKGGSARIGGGGGAGSARTPPDLSPAALPQWVACSSQKSETIQQQEAHGIGRGYMWIFQGKSDVCGVISPTTLWGALIWGPSSLSKPAEPAAHP